MTTLGGRRVEVERPRVRTVDDEHELPVRTYEYFADRDRFTRAVIDRVLAGRSSRSAFGVIENEAQAAEAATAWQELYAFYAGAVRANAHSQMTRSSRR